MPHVKIEVHGTLTCGIFDEIEDIAHDFDEEANVSSSDYGDHATVTIESDDEDALLEAVPVLCRKGFDTSAVFN